MSNPSTPPPLLLLLLLSFLSSTTSLDPPLPYSTNSNRLNDGKSSISPISSTSPAFPIYPSDATLFDPKSRNAHEELTLRSRLMQGIAKPGAGEYEIEQARLFALLMYHEEDENLTHTTAAGVVLRLYDSSLIPPINTTSGEWTGYVPAISTRPSVSFNVHASERFNPSNFAIQHGEAYTISVDTSQTWRDTITSTLGALTTNTEGYNSYYSSANKCNTLGINDNVCRPHLKSKLRYKYSNWLHLICGVGSFGSLLYETIDDRKRYMPINEEELNGNLFEVHVDVNGVFNFVAENGMDGELICFANDDNGLYYDNDGHITVTITRQSWPPSVNFDERYVENLYKSMVKSTRSDYDLYNNGVYRNLFRGEVFDSEDY